MESLEKFLKKYDPIALAQFEASKLKPEDLVGKLVMSIRSGFSAGSGGRVCEVKKLVSQGQDNYDTDYICLGVKGNDETKWLVDPKEFWTDIIMWEGNEKLRKYFDLTVHH